MSRVSIPTVIQVRFAFLITALGGLLFTFDLPLLRLSRADQWTMIFTRGMFLFGAISFMWWIARLRGEKTPFIAGGAGLLVIITSTIGNMSYIGAAITTNAANVVFIIALTPVIAAAMSRVILGERVHAWTWLATVIAFFGVGIIARDGIHAGRAGGDALALVSAFCSASAFTVIRATGKKVATSLAIGNLTSALIALAFFPVSFASLSAGGEYGIAAWIWLGLNGFIVIPMATVLLASGSRVLHSSDVGMFFLLETVLTPVWIWLIFGEKPGPAVLLGGTIVIATLVVHSWWRLSLSLSQPMPNQSPANN